MIDEGKGINLSKEKAVISDDGKLIVFNLKTGVGLILTKEELENLERALAVML